MRVFVIVWGLAALLGAGTTYALTDSSAPALGVGAGVAVLGILKAVLLCLCLREAPGGGPKKVR